MGDEWDEVDACIEEIEWFASRAPNLKDHTDETKHRTWADALQSDINELRTALRAARAASK